MTEGETFIHYEDTAGRCLNCGGLKVHVSTKKYTFYWKYLNCRPDCKHKWIRCDDEHLMRNVPGHEQKCSEKARLKRTRAGLNCRASSVHESSVSAVMEQKDEQDVSQKNPQEGAKPSSILQTAQGRDTFLERYPFTCPKCGKESYAAPSLMMTFAGINTGHGNCPGCKEFLHLEITPDMYGDRMAAISWNDYLKREGIEPKQEVVQ